MQPRAALAIGQYVGVAPGECIHMTLATNTLDQQAWNHINQLLRLKNPGDTGDSTPFCRRMHTANQLGADLMTARIIQHINKE